jgi:hypothetical protein
LPRARSPRPIDSVRPPGLATPPRLEPIAIAGEPPEIQRDQHGNALGGIRLPQLAVPTAQYGPVGTPEALRCDLRAQRASQPSEAAFAAWPAGEPGSGPAARWRVARPLPRQSIMAFATRSIVVLAVLLAGLVDVGRAQQGGGPMGQGGHHGQHGSHGGQGGVGRDGDHADFRFLLRHHDQIRRTVTRLPDGVETLTESDDPAVAAKIREHVAAMKLRLHERRPIHARDPLFAEIFRHAGAIVLTDEATPNGVRVRETSTVPYVAALIHAHAAVVDGFVARGHAEMHVDHPLPERPPPPAS